MRSWVTAGFLVCALSSAVSLGAQAPDTAVSPLAPGVQSLSFQIDYNGGRTGTFGYWRMRSERTNVGWEIGLGGRQAWASNERDDGPDADESNTNLFVQVGPSLRRYVNPGARVVPFVQTGVSVGYGFQRSRAGVEGAPDEQVLRGHRVGLSGSVGLGAEWFPASRVSVSGYTGLSSSVDYNTSDGPFGSQTRWEVNAGTFTTGLAFRIYLLPGSAFR